MESKDKAQARPVRSKGIPGPEWVMEKGIRQDGMLHATVTGQSPDYCLHHTFKIYVEVEGDSISHFLCSGSAPTQLEAMELAELLLEKYKAWGGTYAAFEG